MTAIGTKFALPYACIFMNQVESQVYKPLVWFRYIDDVFFNWAQGQGKLRLFLEDLNKYHPYIKFTHEIKKTLPFWI